MFQTFLPAARVPASVSSRRPDDLDCCFSSIIAVFLPIQCPEWFPLLNAPVPQPFPAGGLTRLRPYDALIQIPAPHPKALLFPAQIPCHAAAQFGDFQRMAIDCCRKALLVQFPRAPGDEFDPVVSEDGNTGADGIEIFTVTRHLLRSAVRQRYRVTHSISLLPSALGVQSL